MGLADTVIPGFLFIVGISIPFAIRNRRQKGDSNWLIAAHIIKRSFALLLMGVFLVNGEYLNETATGILVWNNYPSGSPQKLVYIIQALASMLLVYLAFSYRSGDAALLVRFSVWWWGILLQIVE